MDLVDRGNPEWGDAGIGPHVRSLLVDVDLHCFLAGCEVDRDTDRGRPGNASEYTVVDAAHDPLVCCLPGSDREVGAAGAVGDGSVLGVAGGKLHDDHPPLLRTHRLRW